MIEMEGKMQSIQVMIADRSYPFSIDPEEEEVIRTAAKRISEKVDGYKKRYSVSDNQDALAITVLQYVVQLIKEKRSNTSSVLVRELQLLNNQIDEYIDANMK